MSPPAAYSWSAGFETTVNLVGNGVAALHHKPGAGAQLVADPTLAEAAGAYGLAHWPQIDSRSARNVLAQ